MEENKRCKFDFVAFLAVLILIAFIGCMCVAIAFGIKQQKKLLNVAYAYEFNENLLSHGDYNVDFSITSSSSVNGTPYAENMYTANSSNFSVVGDSTGTTVQNGSGTAYVSGIFGIDYQCASDTDYTITFHVVDFVGTQIYLHVDSVFAAISFNSYNKSVKVNNVGDISFTFNTGSAYVVRYFYFMIGTAVNTYLKFDKVKLERGFSFTGWTDLAEDPIYQQGYADGYDSGMQYGYEHYNLVSAYQFENSIDNTVIGLNNIRSVMASGESGSGFNNPVNTPNHRGKYYDFTYNGELFAKQNFQRYSYSFNSDGSYSVSVPANGGFDNIAAVSTLYLGSAYIGNLFLTFNNAVNDVGFIAVNGSDVRLFRFRQDTIIDNVSCFLVDNYLSAGVLYDFYLVPSSPSDTLLTNTALTVSGMSVVSGIGYYAIYRIKDEMNYEQVYNDGRQAGFDEAVKANAQDVANARSAGYEEGRRDALADSNDYSFMGLLGAVFDAPIKSFQGLLNFDVLGVNMQSFVLALLSLSVIIIILKIALGGK